MVEQGLTHHALAEELEVNVKPVERWVAGDIVPFPRNRHRLAVRLGRDESYLWPDALTRDRAAALSESELVRVYTHRAVAGRLERIRPRSRTAARRRRPWSDALRP
jgi:transcriptional regulator with XRE-family HTH domain